MLRALMHRLLFAVSLVLFPAVPLLAQSVSGMYRGTFTVFIILPPGCTNITSFSYSGTMYGSLTQSGNRLTGAFLLSNVTFVKNEGGICSGFSPQLWDGSTTITDGSLSGNKISGHFIMFGVHPDFEGTVSGSTITVPAKNGQGISFEISRISTVVTPVISFGASRNGPAVGVAGLYWSTAGATSVAIDWAGTRPLFGSFATVPDATRTERLTAVGPSGSAVATFVLKTAMSADADVVLSAAPRGIVQRAGSPLPSDSFTLSNLGGTPTDLTLTTSGPFTVTPPAFRLEPIESHTFSVVATTQDVGAARGSVTVAGTGVNSALTIPLHRLVAQAPATKGVVTSVLRRDLSAPPGQSSAGTVPFTNAGTSTIEGVVVADVPWIRIANPDLILGPGETRQVSLSTERSLRPVLPNSGAAGSISFRYVDVAEPAPLVSTVPVAIYDIVENGHHPFAPAEVTPGAVFTFAIPGVSSSPASLSDLVVSNRRNSAHGFDLILFPPDGGAGQITNNGVGETAGNASNAFPGVVRGTFANSPAGGTIFSNGVDMAFAHTRVNTRGGVSTVTALPVLQPADGYGAGAELFLTGVQKSATVTTTLYLQEMAGTDAAVLLDCFDREGRQLGTTRPHTVKRYGSIELPDAVPAGTASVRVKNGSVGAVLTGFALLLNAETSDVLTVVQFPRGTGDLVCPAFPEETPGTRQLHITLANASAEPITVTVPKSVVESGRRRAVSHTDGPGEIEPLADPVVTIPPFGSRRLLVTGNDTVRIKGPEALRATAVVTYPRTAAASSGGDGGRVGSGIAIVPFSRAITPATRNGLRFAGLEDSTAATVAAARPQTYRSRLMLAEVSGRSTRVHIVVHYAIPGGKGGNTAAHSKDYLIPPNGTIRLYPLAKEIIGLPREALGDLHNASVTVYVVGTANPGTVLAFLEMTDNGTGDVTVRSD